MVMLHTSASFPVQNWGALAHLDWLRPLSGSGTGVWTDWRCQSIHLGRLCGPDSWLGSVWGQRKGLWPYRHEIPAKEQDEGPLGVLTPFKEPSRSYTWFRESFSFYIHFRNLLRITAETEAFLFLFSGPASCCCYSSSNNQNNSNNSNTFYLKETGKPCALKMAGFAILERKTTLINILADTVFYSGNCSWGLLITHFHCFCHGTFCHVYWV